MSRCSRGETVRTAYSTCSDVDTRGHTHSCAHQRINDAFALAGGFRNTCGCARRADVCAVLCLLHRWLFVRCNPSWTSDYCAAELDNPGLTCVPAVQEIIYCLVRRMAYYGPTDTCEARRMRMPGPHAPCCARCCGGLACCAACALCVRALHARAHVCMCVCSSLERRKGCWMHDALLLRDIAMRAKKYLVVRPSAAYIVGTQICRGSGPSTLCWVVPNSFLNISYPV